jgi:hypothetical protein
MRYIWYIPDAVPSGLPTDESEILNDVLWERRTWEKIPEVHVEGGGVGEVIERLFVTIFSFVADGVTYSSTCT